jgi:hypothetical protein
MAKRRTKANVSIEARPAARKKTARSSIPRKDKVPGPNYADNELQRLVGRAVVDRRFVKELLADPKKTLELGGFDLRPPVYKKVLKLLSNPELVLSQLEKFHGGFHVRVG